MDFENLLQKYRSSSVKKEDMQGMQNPQTEQEPQAVPMPPMPPVILEPKIPQEKKKKITVEKLVELLHKKKQEDVDQNLPESMLSKESKIMEPFHVPVPDFSLSASQIPDLEMLYLKGSTVSPPPPPSSVELDVNDPMNNVDNVDNVDEMKNGDEMNNVNNVFMDNVDNMKNVFMVNKDTETKEPIQFMISPLLSTTIPTVPMTTTVFPEQPKTLEEIVVRPDHVVDLSDTMLVKEIREKIRSEEQQRYMSRKEIEEKVQRCVEIADMAEKAVKNMQQHVQRIDLHFRFLRQIMAIDDSEIETYVRDMMMASPSLEDTPALPLPKEQKVVIPRQEIRQKDTVEEETEVDVLIPRMTPLVKEQPLPPLFPLDDQVEQEIIEEEADVVIPVVQKEKTSSSKGNSFFAPLRPVLQRSTRKVIQYS